MLVGFKTAKIAKALGFKNPVSNYYMGSGRIFTYSTELVNHNVEGITKEKYSAPTVEELLTWCNEKYTIGIQTEEEFVSKFKHVED